MKLVTTIFLLFLATFAWAQKGKGLVLELCHPDSFEQKEVLVQIKGPNNIDTFMGKDQSSLCLHALDTGRYWLCLHAPNKALHVRRLKVYEAYYVKTYVNLFETDSTEIASEGGYQRFLNQFGTCHTDKGLSFHVTNAERDELLHITVQLLQTDTLEYGTFTLYDGTVTVPHRAYGNYQVFFSHVGGHSVSENISHALEVPSHFALEMEPKLFVLNPYIEHGGPEAESLLGPYGQDPPIKSSIYREMSFKRAR